MDASASRAGIDVLRHGGNAVDAAVATASALGVTVPFVAGPGGGGFMVIYNARTHTVTTIDGRETCPQSCTRSLFLDPRTHKPMDYVTASDQPLSTGVPSMVATWALAVKRFGRQSLKADLRPAISIARHGFAVNRDFRQLTRSGTAADPRLSGEPPAVPHAQGQPAAARARAAQPRPRPHLRRARRPRPRLPVRRAARPGDRQGRRYPDAHPGSEGRSPPPGT